MGQIGGLLSSIVFVVIAIVVLVAIVIYSVRLQRGAVVTQKAVVEDHFAEKTQRQRQYAVAEESLAIQKEAAARALASDEQGLALLKRSVELNEEILKVLKDKA